MLLGDHDAALLAGEEGPGPALAMKLVTRVGDTLGAEVMIDITSAHIDGCLYHGQAGLDFAHRLLAGGARVVVPSTLNVSSLDLLHPHLFRGDEATRRAAADLMEAYVSMGCIPTWTCAPYQLPTRPGLGEHVAWAESNAIVFANSVLGARTGRYGDFFDICAAVTGRVPAAGLHLDHNRLGGLVFRLEGIPNRLLAEDALYPVLGHLLGRRAGDLVPVITGLPAEASEDRLKALGAGAASSGRVAMFHAVGITPEAPSVEAAVGERDTPVVTVTPADLAAAAADLTTATEGAVQAVCVGTPHFSEAEFTGLAELIAGRRLRLPLYVNTGRGVLAELEKGTVEELESAGVTVVTDTCTYITPILDPDVRVVMTDSAKWAYYAPSNLGVEVVFGSLAECVETAVAGRLRRDERLWG